MLARALALVTALLVALSVLVWQVPAQAVGTGAISKQLDGTQGNGFTAPNTFATGALVRYRLTVSCSSLQTDCGIGTVIDDLDPQLEYVGIVRPTTNVPIAAAAVGQRVTLTLGTAASPWPDGNTLEIVLIARVRTTATGAIPNTSSITTTDGPTQQSQTVTIQAPPASPNWGVDKSGPGGNPAVGEDVSYTIRFTSPSLYGNLDITGGTLVDTYPAGAVVVDPAGGVVDTTNRTITWTLPRITSATEMNCSPQGTNCSSYWYKTVVREQLQDEFLRLQRELGKTI
ncbi:MAG: hypothetical protein WAW88_04095, partial [Nocardioides sp.]